VAQKSKLLYCDNSLLFLSHPVDKSVFDGLVLHLSRITEGLEPIQLGYQPSFERWGDWLRGQGMQSLSGVLSTAERRHRPVF